MLHPRSFPGTRPTRHSRPRESRIARACADRPARDKQLQHARTWRARARRTAPMPEDAVGLR
eukprot:6240807-Prymnesium_polylepis.1